MRIGSRTFDFSCEVAVMGITNRTPDSFSDAGRSYALTDAVAQALGQVEDGADILDLGGVKAGPGTPVDVEEELDRVLPLVTELRRRTAIPLSVDTSRARVAQAALQAGADVVNDVSGLVEVEVADVVAAHPHAVLVVMHAGGAPRTRPHRVHYEPDVTTVVVETCRRLAAYAIERGVPPDRLVVDPGHDFRKNTFHSLELTRRLPELAALGHPILVALSNKDFLGETLDLPVDQRLEASLAAACVAVERGARIIRAHDVRATVRAIHTVEAIKGWRQPAAPVRGLA